MNGELTGPATHVIPFADVCAWLAEYGFDANDVVDCRVEIGRVNIEPGGAQHVDGEWAICAWLDIEWYRLTPDGNRYFFAGDDTAATGHSTVPLHSWPPLRAQTEA